MIRVAYICLFCLPGSLCILLVNPSSNCPAGWFGTSCRFKCRCVNDSCDGDGMCLLSEGCQGGWFGLSCQYADLAYGKGNLSLLTDGNDSTCVDLNEDITNVSLEMEELTVFTWMRAHVRDPDVIETLAVVFTYNGSHVDCQNMQSFFLDEKTVDIYCNMTEVFDSVILTGAAIRRLCSVYISGGRNVALKESASHRVSYGESSAQTNNVYINFTGDKAVDGNRNHYFYNLGCAHAGSDSTWTLILSTPALVNRYLIYNRLDVFHPARIAGFTLTSYDSRNRSVLAHTDTSPYPLNVYSMVHPSAEVKTVIFTHTRSYIVICEVEVYGESICPKGKYGLECDKTCWCPDKSEYCFVNNGGCTSGCAIGYHGEGCKSACPPETFGYGCERNCSQFCEKDTNKSTSCKDLAGTCTLGCVSGYEGASCRENMSCPSETFGPGCTSKCSQFCEKDDKGPSCNSRTGTCNNGCLPGYQGTNCTQKCPREKFGKDCKSQCEASCLSAGDGITSYCNPVNGSCVINLRSVIQLSDGYLMEAIIAMCTLLAAAFLLGAIFCAKKKRAVNEAEGVA